MAGRAHPHRRGRVAIAALLGETEADLWPQASPDLNRVRTPQRKCLAHMPIGPTSPLEPLHGVADCAIGLRTVHLYNAVFRFDPQTIVTPYLCCRAGSWMSETLVQCVVREVKEETGLDIEITGPLGIYTDPPARYRLRRR